jgi:hypothetical protein
VLALGEIFSISSIFDCISEHLWRLSKNNGPIRNKSSARENVPGKKELNQRELAKILSAAKKFYRNLAYILLLQYSTVFT